ncbi:urease accessory protein UreD [Brachybacterium saurashtrense]|uniref:Urease accessory protein n=1 Tax=Brachybacterium saurashtrense TaxID=556288 RepID=A0A345YJX8_9MICO|nr:urease accessory protein UreD [Brachybacterium saurashtrense]AXK44230.1 urease accessory protein [Brachybacterium saurashtrense]RRR21502.1 urease accessory protein [Brachybacterium saurashtrense]
MTRIALAPVPGGPVRVTTTPGLLQARTVSRGADRAHVALVAGGAMLVGGDRIAVEVEVAEGCALELEDVGGTLAYPGEGRRSAFDVRIRLERGARLIWRAHPFVVADGAAVDRRLELSVAEGASACLRETLVLGRTGERGGTLRAGLHARTPAAAPLLCEELDLDGARPVTGVMGAHRVLDSVLLLGARPAPEAAVPSGVSVLHLHRRGALARILAHDAHATGLDPLMEEWAAGLRVPDSKGIRLPA